MSGLRRNLLLSWRPDISGDQLQQASQQRWAAEMPEGSARLKTAWYAERMHWLDSEGRPLAPDWNMSETARELSDLIEWDYLNPQLKDEPADIEADEMPLEFADEAFAAQELRLTPALKSALLRRRMAASKDEHISEALLRKKSKLNSRKLVRQTRKSLGSSMRKQLLRRLAGNSRGEALAALKPSAGKAAKKASVVLKLKLKSKLQLAAKKSAALEASKQKEKTALDKAAAAEASKSASHGAELGDLPPLPPPAEPPVDSASLIGKQLRITAESAGPTQYGILGKCISHTLSTGTVLLSPEHANNGRVATLASQCTEEASALAPLLPWKTMTALSRSEKQSMLRLAGLQREGGDVLEVVTESTTMILDQTLMLGWLFMRWSWRQSGEADAEQPGLEMLDPLVLVRYQASLLEGGDSQLWRKAILSHISIGTKRILSPIYGFSPGQLLVSG